MSGTFNIQSEEYLKQSITKKALSAKAGENWMGWSKWDNGGKEITFKAEDIFIVPEEYKTLQLQVKENNDAIAEKIKSVRVSIRILNRPYSIGI